jgi:transcriptional regulator with XRE-family HTH domain
MAQRTSLTSSRATGAQTDTVHDYTVAGSETVAHAIEASWLRDRARLLGNETEGMHRDLQERALRERAAVKVRKGIRSLLAELGEDRGMGWSDMAELVGVSVAAIRKWRKGGDATPESRMRLASLAAFLDCLSELAIEEPVQWLEVRLPLPSEYLIRPVDLYRDGHAALVLDIAAQRLTAEAALDEIDVAWRDRCRTRFEVYAASDGQRAIRIRDE